MSTTEQCIAITDAGDRCSRPAQSDGLCFQHDAGADTVETGEAAAFISDGSGDDEKEEGSAMDIDQDIDPEQLREVVEEINETAEEILGLPVETIVGIHQADGGWIANVQVIERKGVPDTQDILARYEVQLNDSVAPVGYERTHRFRRDQMGRAI